MICDRKEEYMKDMKEEKSRCEAGKRRVSRRGGGGATR